MRLIDADALELEGWYLSRHYIVDSKTGCTESKTIKEVPTAQPNLQPTCNQLATDTISRQAAIDEIKALYEWHDKVTEDRTIDHLKRLPPAQPEIIRCKDCKHYDPNDHCYLQGAEADDFCSYAERREE